MIYEDQISADTIDLPESEESLVEITYDPTTQAENDLDIYTEDQASDQTNILFDPLEITSGDESVPPLAESDGIVLSDVAVLSSPTETDDSSIAEDSASEETNILSTSGIDQGADQSTDQAGEETNLYNIDDIYTKLQSGVLVYQETEVQDETEASVTDLYNRIDDLYSLESEAFLSINNNIADSSANSSMYGDFLIALLSAILGGLVAIGIFKGLH